MTDSTETNVKVTTIDKMGWAGLRRFSGVVVPNSSSKYIIPMGSFTPTMVVSLAVFPEEVAADSAPSKAAWGYFNVATGELTVWTATSTKKTSGNVTVDLVVMGI